VLDLTRVLAGPTASRFLAGLGANVLRIDPPSWNEPGVVPEMTVGKRCARLDLQAPADRAVFEGLLKDADILLHGYRADALEHLG
ncbi:CoA transferase, partial [Psychrobacter sp. TB20-MNA-CIBAN-0197]